MDLGDILMDIVITNGLSLSLMGAWGNIEEAATGEKSLASG